MGYISGDGPSLRKILEARLTTVEYLHSCDQTVPPRVKIVNNSYTGRGAMSHELLTMADVNTRIVNRLFENSTSWHSHKQTSRFPCAKPCCCLVQIEFKHASSQSGTNNIQANCTRHRISRCRPFRDNLERMTSCHSYKQKMLCQKC